MATLHEHINFGGNAVLLEESGNYTLGMLQAKGAKGDDVSSLTLAAGYEAFLYEHDNFGGESLNLTSSHSNLGELNFNDKLSSIRIRKTVGASGNVGNYLGPADLSKLISWMPGGVVTPTGGVPTIVFAPPTLSQEGVPNLLVTGLSAVGGQVVWTYSAGTMTT